jgi:two-component system phosphate regulon sensor histidine kinase PhoR
MDESLIRALLAVVGRSGEPQVLRRDETPEGRFSIDMEHDVGQLIKNLVRHPTCSACIAANDSSKSVEITAAGKDHAILSARLVPCIDSQWLLLSHDLAQAAQLEATRREYVDNTLHELGTPLTVLLAYLHAVRELNLDSKRAHEYLDRIEQQCERMRRIIRDLLQLSTLAAARAGPGDKRVDMNGLLAQIHSETEALSAGRHRTALDAEAGLDLLGDASEIASAFGNLASNAVRYTPPGGEVRIIWRTSQRGAEFAVEDTGVGIEEEHIPRLTERFYRVDPVRSPGSDGTGLGLAIVKCVLDRHQAFLEIESKLGEGSRFVAKFPACRVTSAVPERSTRDAKA